MQEKRARIDLLKTLKRDGETAPAVDRKFLAEQRRGLDVEWASVADTGERKWRHGEVVTMYARRQDRWSPLTACATPHPASIARCNIDGTLDVVFL